MKIKILTFLLALFISSDAFAGSCTRPPVHEQYKNADIVFRGIVKNDPLGANKCGSKTAIFDVKEVYKGKFINEVSIFTIDSCTMTGSSFKKDKEYTVFAYSDRNYFEPDSNEPVQFFISHACSGTHQIDPRHYQYFEDPHPFMAKLNNHVKAYDLLLAQPDFNGEDLLTMKSQHYLYWEDYDNAVSTLEELYNKNSSNEWVLENLLLSLYEANQPEKIWNVYLNNKNLYQDINEGVTTILNKARIVNYAAFILDKEYEIRPLGYPTFSDDAKKTRQTDVVLVDIRISGLNKNNSEITAYFSNTDFNQFNFSNSTFKGDFYEARFFNSDFTNAKFGNIKMKDVKMHNSKLEGADFSNVQIENLSLERSTYDDTTKWPEGFDPEKAGAYIAGTKTFLDPVNVE